MHKKIKSRFLNYKDITKGLSLLEVQKILNMIVIFQILVIPTLVSFFSAHAHMFQRLIWIILVFF
jgi:hypothetical protein